MELGRNKEFLASEAGYGTAMIDELLGSNYFDPSTLLSVTSNNHT